MEILPEEPRTSELPRQKRRAALQAILALALLAIVLATGLYLTSNSFQNRVRSKVIGELELMTGGRVELQSFRWNLSRLEIVADNLTIHGLEKPGEAPYVHLDHLVVRAKIFSLWRKEIGLRYVSVRHPVIHIIAYPDGSTNQPTPKQPVAKIGRQSSDALEQLFDLRLGRLEVNNGLFIWNDDQTPLNFVADDVAAGLRYVAAKKLYETKLRIGKLKLNYQGSPNMDSHVEAELRLHRGSIDVSQFHWATAASSVDAKGSITDFRNLKANGNYRASLDLAEAARVAGVLPLRRGSLDINGQVNFLSPEKFFSTGKMQLRNLGWSDASMHLAGVDAVAEFSLDARRANFSHVIAHALGGTFSGNAQVLDWTPSAKKKERGNARFDIAGVQLAQVENAISGGRQPNSQLRIFSEANGKLELQWTGPPANADATLMADLAAPADLPRPELPLHGSVDLTYHGSTQHIEVRKLNLAARDTRFDATGELGATAHPNAALRINVNTTNFSELEALLRAAGGTNLPSQPRATVPHEYWKRPPSAQDVDLHGHASFSGIVTGQLRAPALNGHLEISNFDTIIPVSANASVAAGPVSSSAASPERVHWDSFTANVLYSPSMASIKNGMLHRGTAQITLTASAGLEQGKFTGNSPVNAQIKVSNAEIKDIQSLIGKHYPVSGTINAQGLLTGTQNNLRGSGELQATGGEFYGRPYQSLQAHLAAQGKDFQVTNLLLKMRDGTVLGGAGYDLETRVFGLDLRGENFDLAQFVPPTSNLNVAGTGDFTLNGSGTLDQPTINANVVLRGVKLNQQPMGDLTVNGTTSGGNLHLTGRSSLQNPALEVDGDIHLSGDFPGKVKLAVQNLDIEPLIAGYISGAPAWHSLVTGNATVDGPLKRPKLLHAAVEIPQLSADVAGVNIHNDGPVRFSVQNEVVSVEQFHMVGTDTDLYAAGTAELGTSHGMRIRTNGHMNLKALQTLDPNLLSYGTTSFELDANGTFAHPELNGTINIHNAGLSIVDAPNGLTEMNGTLLFEQDHLQIGHLTAKSGGGNLDLSGTVRYENGLFFDLTATGQEVRVRYPAGMSSQATSKLHFIGTTQNAALSGDILITRFGMSPHFDIAQYLARAKKPPVPPDPNSVVDNIRLDLHVTSTPGLEVETSLARLAGDVDLRVKGTVANPSLLGRVNIADGEVFFNTTRYHLERGDVTFSNPVQIQPVINLEASTRVRDYDITLGFHGRAENLNTSYRSEPPLPTSDIIALLAFGQTNQDTQQQTGQQGFSDTASNAILGEALTNVVNNRVQNLFGMSKVKIDPAANTAENPNARLLTIEQQISNKATVTYSPNLNQTGQQVISVEYNINPNISIVTIRDQNGIFGMDLRIRQRKR